MKIDMPSHLSDDDLVAQVKSLAQCEREATASFVAYLAELDARRLYLAAGFSSLFGYCCEVRRLSEPAAYNRIEVARAAQRFPVILPMLGEGSLSLATARLLASNLTAENQQGLLAAAPGKSKRQVEEMLVRCFPGPDVPASVRRLPASRVMAMPGEAVLPASSDAPAVQPGGPSAVTSPSVLPDPARRPVVRPLAPDRYETGSRRAARRARSYVWRKTCCDTRFPAATWRRSSIGRSPRCSQTWPERSSGSRSGRGPVAVPLPTAAISRPRSGVGSG